SASPWRPLRRQRYGMRSGQMRRNYLSRRVDAFAHLCKTNCGDLGFCVHPASKGPFRMSPADSNHKNERPLMMQFSPRYDRPAISLIATGLGEDGVSLYLGDSEGARDIALLKEQGITTVINCAVNLDFNYVNDPVQKEEPGKVAA